MIPTEILGFPVPDTRPLFVTALAVHVLAGLTAITAGALAASARKRPGRHPRAGTVYLVAVTTVAATATVMAVLRWSHNWHLFLIAMGTGGLAWSGWLVRRHAGRWWMAWHGSAMGTSYAGLLTGFYVDNGARLPVWDRLPPVAYWVLPAAVAVPLILLALVRNRALPVPRRPVAGRGSHRPER